MLDSFFLEKSLKNDLIKNELRNFVKAELVLLKKAKKKERKISKETKKQKSTFNKFFMSITQT